jgi:guanylate cyclase 2D/E/F
MALLDRYKNNLHDIVKERTAELEEEKMRSERLLLQLLPP